MTKEAKQAPEYLRSMSTSDQTKLALMANDIQYIRKSVDELTDTVRENYTPLGMTQSLTQRLEMVEKVVYGMIGVILLGFIGAVISFFIRR